MNLLLLILLLVIQVADVATTAIALNRGAEEANLLPAFLFRAFGFWPTAIAVKLAIVLVALALTLATPSAWAFTGVLDLIGLAVLANNVRVVQEVSDRD